MPALQDPLAQLFSFLQVDTFASNRLEARGDWALFFPRSDHVRFGGVLEGGALLAVDGAGPPVRLERGDGFVLTQGRPFRLYTDASRDAVDGIALFRSSTSDVARVGQAGMALSVFVAGRFTASELTHAVLLNSLPAVIHLPARHTASPPILKAALSMLDFETSGTSLGANVVRHHVAQIMLVEGLRTLLAASNPVEAGLLGAMADPQIGPALQRIHFESGQRWTVQQLAQACGMSRALFAQRFKARVGESPIRYIQGQRMRKAALMLANGRHSVSAVAYASGYESLSAFTVAFRSVIGMAPKAYSRSLRPSAT